MANHGSLRPGNQAGRRQRLEIQAIGGGQHANTVPTAFRPAHPDRARFNFVRAKPQNLFAARLAHPGTKVLARPARPRMATSIAATRHTDQPFHGAKKTDLDTLIFRQIRLQTAHSGGVPISVAIYHQTTGWHLSNGQQQGALAESALTASLDWRAQIMADHRTDDKAAYDGGLGRFVTYPHHC